MRKSILQNKLTNGVKDMESKKSYETSEMEIMKFDTEDIIITCPPTNPGNDTPPEPIGGP